MKKEQTMKNARKTMKFWINSMIAATAAMSLMSAVCSAQEPIVIGVSVPLTGQYAENGNSIRAGVELAVNELNEAGGIHGRPLEIILGDSEGSPDIAKRVARKFVNDSRIVAEIGDFTSSCSMAAQPIYERGGMVQLSPTTSHPSFAPGSPYSFSIVGIQAGAPFMAKVAVERLGKKRFATATLQTDWGIAIKEAFLDEARRRGAEIVADEFYFEGTTDFSELVKTLQTMRPSVLFLASMTADAAGISKQIQDAGWSDVLLMGSQSLHTPELIQLAGPAVERLIVPTLFFLQDPRPEVRRFVNAYETAYQSLPNWFAAIGYDTLNLLSEAIKQGGVERRAIQQTLAATTEYSGVTGNVVFGPHGDVLREYTLLQVKNGEFVLFGE